MYDGLIMVRFSLCGSIGEDLHQGEKTGCLTEEKRPLFCLTKQLRTV